MATHSSILAWEISWTEEPGRLQSLGSQESDTTERLSNTSSTSIKLSPEADTKETRQPVTCGPHLDPSSTNCEQIWTLSRWCGTLATRGYGRGRGRRRQTPLPSRESSGLLEMT